LYHKQSIIYKSDCFEPLQTGCHFSERLKGYLHDDEGDNISHKNKNYAELTGNYWVWKNYLPAHPEVEYVGFCHYRRFLDFSSNPHNDFYPFKIKHSYSSFLRRFSSRYNEAVLYSKISSADIILPGLWKMDVSSYDFYKGPSRHPESELQKLITIIHDNYPDYIQDLNRFLSSSSWYCCLNYIMKRSLFNEYMSWIFDILQRLELKSNWSSYRDYHNERIAAYLAERFINVWILHKTRTKGISILERQGLLLIPDNELKWYQPLSDILHFCKNVFLSIGQGVALKRIGRRLNNLKIRFNTPGQA